MLSEPLKLNKIDAGAIIGHLYAIFRRDFVDSKAMLNGVLWVDPQVNRKSDGYESTFWHLTTREHYEITFEGKKRIKKPMGRYPDMDRACRLEWVRQIIDEPNNQRISWFYYQENNDKKDIRLYLWAVDEDFVVILQKLGKSSTFLVTSFYLDNPGKRKSYQARYDAYTANTNPALANSKWF